jgi:hypothetical protein
MHPECRLVVLMRDIVASSRKSEAHGLCFVAQSALNIVEGLSANHVTPGDIACLADLIREFAREGYGEVLAYIEAGAPDCEVCAALNRHLQPAA